MVWRSFTPSRYAVRLTQTEIDTSTNETDFIIINPDYKSTFFSKNKNWGFEKYQQLTNILYEDGHNIIRLKPGGNYNEPDLKNATNIYSDNLKKSIAIMSKAKLGITYDGLVTHVLSGFNIPVVNIQGGFVDEKTMSYDNNINIGYQHPKTPCGATYPCTHCDEANEYITVDMVYEACKKLL